MEGIEFAAGPPIGPGPRRARRRTQDGVEGGNGRLSIHVPFDPHEELSRFAPQPIVRRITRGEGVDSGERQVSVLFADLRGYTAYAEQHQPREVFAAVNRYADALTSIVQHHAGHVVDFEGDGMMAVFGAPDDLPEKERSALDAARGICRIVTQIARTEPPGGPRLSVGVGIATGLAFVGGIRAGNRTFWSAVGNTTNLASRLQRLTRRLDAVIVIDAHTWRNAGAAARGLVCRPQVTIRGRKALEDVYVLGPEAL